MKVERGRGQGQREEARTIQPEGLQRAAVLSRLDFSAAALIPDASPRAGREPVCAVSSQSSPQKLTQDTFWGDGFCVFSVSKGQRKVRS